MPKINKIGLKMGFMVEIDNDRVFCSIKGERVIQNDFNLNSSIFRNIMKSYGTQL